MLRRDFDLSCFFCCWRGLEGRYSIALMLVPPSSVLAGLGKAIEAGGASLSTETLGKESLLAVGKMGLPGSGVGAWLVLMGGHSCPENP